MRVPSFAYRKQPGDPLLAAFARAERVARAVLRSLLAGRLPRSVAPLFGYDRPMVTGPRVPSSASPIVLLAALPWEFRFQRPQHLAKAIAVEGTPVLYVDGFLRTCIQPRRTLTPVADGVWRLALRVPGRPDLFRTVLTRAAADSIAETIAEGLAVRPLAVVAQIPGWAGVAQALRCRLGCPLVYDRIDLHTHFPGVPPELGEVENELVRCADLVTATSEDLKVRSRRLSRKVQFLPNGVDLKAIGLAPHLPGAGGRVGFVGSLDERIDAEALAGLAVELADWDLILAGRVTDAAVEGLGRLPNVELVGEIAFEEVSAFLAGLDVGLAPYRDLELTRAIDSVKIYEMLAAGLPVVARRLRGTAGWKEPLVYHYDAPRLLGRSVMRAREEDKQGFRHDRRESVEAHSWQLRARQLLGMLPTPGADSATGGSLGPSDS